MKIKKPINKQLKAFVITAVFMLGFGSVKAMPGTICLGDYIPCHGSAIANTCGTALKICDTTKFSVPMICSTSSDIVPSCSGTAALKSVWIAFTVLTDGTIAWTATPDDETRFHWALWDITDGCPGTEISCFGGILSCGESFGMGTSGGAFYPVVNAIAGRTYAILFKNIDDKGVGFEFEWQGTAIIDPGGTSGFVSSTSDPTACGSTDGSISLGGLEPNAIYSIWYNEGVLQGPFSFTSDGAGTIIIDSINGGIYENFIIESSFSSCAVFIDTIIYLPYAIPTVYAEPDKKLCGDGSVKLIAYNPYEAAINWNNGVIDGEWFEPPPGVTTYTVTAELNGCFSSDSVVVSAYPDAVVYAGPDQVVCSGDSVTLSGSGADSYWWTGGVLDGVPFIPPPNTTTLYSLGSLDSNGCYDGDNLLVTSISDVDAGPDQTVCGDEQIVLMASGSDSYLWNNGITDGEWFQPPLGITTYTVTAELSGCFSSDSTTVTAYPAVVVYAGPDQVVCPGDSVTLSGSGAISYSWSNGVSDGIPFVPPPNTITYYSVGGYDSNGCYDSDDVLITSTSGVDAGPDQVVCGDELIALIASGSGFYSWSNGVTNGAYFQPPMGVTTYTVTAELDGCVSTDSVVVSAYPPAAEVYAGPDHVVCNGESVILSGSGSVYYIWSGGVSDGVAFLPPPNTTTSYVVVGTDSNGCNDWDTLLITSTSLPVVTWNSITHDDGSANGAIDIYPGGGTPPYSFSWSGPNGFTSASEDISLLEAGEYAVEITDDNGCTAVETFTVLSTVGIYTNPLENQLSIFPNPTNGVLTLSTSLQQTFSYRIEDIYGREIIPVTEFSKKTEVDLSNQAPGIYFVIIESANGDRSTQRIVKN